MELSDNLYSRVEAAKVQGHNKIITCRSIQPLKILNPTSQGAAHLVLSNYGGGMVAGDKVGLQIKTLPDTELLITTQSNSRIFKSTSGLKAEQDILGEVGENALCVLIPDPLIPHENSLFFQKQQWDVGEKGLLFLIDWFSSGRSESGEQFLFTEYASHISISYNGKLILNDNFSCIKGQNNPRSPGVFGKYNLFINGYVVGDPKSKRYEKIKDYFLTLNKTGESALENNLTGEKEYILVTDEVKPGLLTLRAMATRRMDTTPLLSSIGNFLESKDFLGFDFTSRKL